jgi:RNA polymerase sigma-70 factor (ECF subfamily)
VLPTASVAAEAVLVLLEGFTLLVLFELLLLLPPQPAATSRRTAGANRKRRFIEAPFGFGSDWTLDTDTVRPPPRFNDLNQTGFPTVFRAVALRRQSRTTDTEEDLVRALYAEHGSALTGYVARITGDRQRAEDIVQETLLRAWRKSGSLRGDAASMRSWLFTVAHNLAIDERRSRSARNEDDAAGLADVPAAGQLDRALEAWQITEALTTLSRDHREALIETYFRGRSVAEAAALLGVAPGTVKSRTYYALRGLRAALEERGWGA